MNIDELSGAHLDFAVAKAIGIEAEVISIEFNLDGVNNIEKCIYRDSRGKKKAWNPSTDWAQGGPLIDKFNIDLTHTSCGGDSEAFSQDYEKLIGWVGNGDTVLIAAMRAIVARFYGDDK